MVVGVTSDGFAFLCTRHILVSRLWQKFLILWAQ